MWLSDGSQEEMEMGCSAPAGGGGAFQQPPLPSNLPRRRRRRQVLRLLDPQGRKPPPSYHSAVQAQAQLYHHHHRFKKMGSWVMQVRSESTDLGEAPYHGSPTEVLFQPSQARAPTHIDQGPPCLCDGQSSTCLVDN